LFCSLTTSPTINASISIVAMTETYTAVSKFSTMLLVDKTEATASDQSPRQILRRKRGTIGITKFVGYLRNNLRRPETSADRFDEPDLGLARRSIVGLKQLFKLHGTIQTAMPHCAAFLTSSDLSQGCDHRATLMQHIRHHTNYPVTEVIAYDETLNNAIDAPYILMKNTEDIPAIDMWFGQPYKAIPNAEMYLHAGDPSPKLEQKRTTFLRSLAQAMSQLAPLKFNEIGIPVFSDLESEQTDYVGSVWRWHSKLDMQALTPIGAFKASRNFFAALLNEVWNSDHDYEIENKSREVTPLRGVRKILGIVNDSPPSTPTSTSSEQNSEEDNGEIIVTRKSPLSSATTTLICRILW
jgi:hypothetical protein